MSYALLFPGLNSLLNPGARERFSDFPQVQARVREAEDFYFKHKNGRLDIHQLLRLPTEQIYSRARISQTALAIVAIQVGVADQIMRQLGPPGWVIGCSLGDLARTVVAQSCSFEAAMSIALSEPQNLHGADQIGGSVAVLSSPKNAFKEDSLKKIATLSLDISQLSPTLLNVSGSFSALEKLKTLATLDRWKVLQLIDYPVHSAVLEPYKEYLKEIYSQVSFQQPQAATRMFSTVLKKPIESQSELDFEMRHCLLLPHHWHSSILNLLRDHKVSSFINLGPCRTLSRLVAHAAPNLKVSEAESYF